MIESVPPVSALSLRTASPHPPVDTPGFDNLTSGLSAGLPAGLSPGGAGVQDDPPPGLGALFFDLFKPEAQGEGLRHVNRMLRDDLSLGTILKESLQAQTLFAKIGVLGELSKGFKNAINSLIQSA